MALQYGNLVDAQKLASKDVYNQLAIVNQKEKVKQVDGQNISRLENDYNDQQQQRIQEGRKYMQVAIDAVRTNEPAEHIAFYAMLALRYLTDDDELKKILG